MKALFVLGAAAAVALSGPAVAGNLLTNGSFESGIGGGSGWTVTHTVGTAPVVIAYGSATPYPTGAFGEAIGPNGVTSASTDAVGNSVLYFSSDNNIQALDSVSQSFSVVNGQTYDFGFDLYAPLNGLANPADAAFGIRIDGIVQVALFAKSLPSGATWYNYAGTYTATSTGLVDFEIVFGGLGTSASDYGADIAIDRAYVSAAVPEPATWAMMIAGFGLAGAALRRRRTAVSFA